MVRRLLALAAAVALLPATAHARWHHIPRPGCIWVLSCLTPQHQRLMRYWHIQHHKLVTIKPYRSWFHAVATCESGRRWHLNTGNGFYGGLQFTLSSWHGVGGRGYPHQASWLEQTYRGVKLLHSQGPGAWPVCSRSA
jgi:hypothetical protein